MTKNLQNFFIFIATIFLINFIVSLFFLYNEKLNIKFFKSYEVIKIKEKNIEIYKSFNRNKNLLIDSLKIKKKNFSSNNHKSIKNHKILIIGDSHSEDLFFSFKNVEDQINKSEFFHTSLHCKKKLNHCNFPQLKSLEALDVFKDFDVVILSLMYDFHNTNEESIEILNKFFVQKHKKKLIIANMSPVFYVGNSDPVTTFFLKKGYEDFDTSKIEIMENFAFKLLKPDVLTKNNNLKQVTEKFKIELLDRFSTFCNILEKKCKIISNDKKVYFLDHSHLTTNGAQALGIDLLKFKHLYQGN